MADNLIHENGLTYKRSLGTAQKLTAGAVAYRERNGLVEWFVFRSVSNGKWELPKTEVRRGESSVQASLRHVRDGIGLVVTVLDEASRLSISTTQNGQPLDQKILFYLMRQVKGSPNVAVNSGKWLSYALARKSLTLGREQKALQQASILVKQWKREKKTRRGW